MGQVATPPGWYSDGRAQRWWDGTSWGPYAPVAPRDVVAEGRTLAVITHFGFFAGWFVLPLIIRIVGGKDNEYVKHHATEALNFMITASIVGFVTFVGYFAMLIASASDGGVGLFWFWLPMFVVWGVQAAVLGFSIMGAVRASQGVWWRYPISIRFVPGARPPQ
jgi:uncharacterized protein